MIKKISQIKSFGIYKDFNWGNLPEFTSKNLIYGWNYSGKTTLSRLFACLEHRCLIDDFHEGQFEIVLSDNSLINSNNLPKAPIPNVKVFNEDFIQKNLKWSGESFTPILLLGENSIEKSNLITELEQRIDVLRKKQAESKKNSTEVEEQYEQDLTNLASNIKDILRLGTYTKTHVKKEINNISSNDFLKDEDLLQGLLISATTDDNLDEIVEFTTKVDSKILQHEVDELLQKVPQIAQSIEEYENDAELSNWVEKGLSIHANSQTCKFCNSTLTLERLAILNNYFSKEYKDLHSKIKALIDKLKDSTITISLPDENRFHKEFRVKYTSTRSRVSEAISIINNTIYLWLEILNKKLLNTFEKFTLPEFQEIELLQELDELNQIITSHNKKCREFELQKKQALLKLQKHYISRYIIEKKYLYNIKKASVLSKLSQRYSEQIDKIVSQVSKLEAEISSIHKGRENINKYIHGFLGRSDLSIHIEQRDRNEAFVLKRNDNVARNLSEGEKTAVAFSYFLANLDSINVSNSIIFIDDPISSLDSNHIYHVYSLISNVLFDDKNLKCKQLFISTHNFEFYSILKDSKQLKIDANTTGKYLIRRDSNNISTIKELPKQLQKFKSEYQYLFKILDDFRNEKDKESYPLLFVLPSIIRKFLESYTSTRLPNNSGLEERVKELFNDDISSKEILKFIHSHNHFNGVMQQSRHDDTINLCEPTVDYILNWLETNDNMHYQSLCEATT